MPPRSLAGALILTSLCLIPLLPWLDAPGHRPQDEGLLLVYPELILRGLFPPRDFLTSYPPGNFFALAAVFAWFEPSLTAERLVGLGYRVALVFGVFALGATRGSAIAAATGCTAAFLLLPLRLEAASWLGGLAALVWASWALFWRLPRIAGLLLGAALSFRLDFLPAALGLCATQMWLLHINSDTARSSSAFGLRLLQGLACFLLPLVLYFGWVSPQSSFRDLLLDPVFVSGPARRLPLDSLSTTSLRLLLLLITSSLLSLVLCWNERELPHSERRTGALIAVLSLGLLPQALQRLDADHLLYVLVVVGGLLPLCVDRLLADRFKRSAALLLSFAVLLPAAGAPISSLLLNFLDGGPPFEAPGWIHRNDRRLPARNRHELFAFAQLGTTLDESIREHERLFIGPRDLSQTNYSDLHLYFLFPELTPASYFLELNPRSANRYGTRLTDDLARADWLLLSAEWNHWDEANASSTNGDSRPNGVLRRAFEPVDEYGLWTLYRRRPLDALPSGMD